MDNQNKDWIRLKLFREVGKLAEDMTAPVLEEMESAGMLPGTEARHELHIQATVICKASRWMINIRARQTRTCVNVPAAKMSWLDTARPALPGMTLDGDERRPGYGTPGQHAGTTPRVWKPQAALCQLCGKSYIRHTGNQVHCPDCIAELGHRPGKERDAIKEQIRKRHATRLKLVAQLNALETPATDKREAA